MTWKYLKKARHLRFSELVERPVCGDGKFVLDRDFCSSIVITAHYFIRENLVFKLFSLTMMLSASAKTSLAVSRSSLQSNASRSVGATRTFAKQIKFGVEGRAAMLKGVDMLADAVQVSLSLLASYRFLHLKIPFVPLIY
jgi:hypothetical protein